MRILLTGAYGMVGRNFREHPEAEEFDLLLPSRGELDLLDGAKVAIYLEQTKPDLVIHAAGVVGGIEANIREPVRFFKENLDMGMNVVCGAYKAGVKRLLNLGSSCMYPRTAENPLKEESILQGELEPTNEGYALAKLAVARMCTYIGKEAPEFHYKTLLPCNLYGRWDKFEQASSHLVPAIIRKVHQAMAEGKASVGIWGDGTARREFMYAGDFADCLVRAVKRFDQLPPLMNVGIGYDYTVNDYYQAVADVLGYKGQFVHDLSKPVGMRRKIVSIDRLTEWGWKSKTDLRTGILATYDYFCEQCLS
jgi:GDP-L-fucose synthase